MFEQTPDAQGRWYGMCSDDDKDRLELESAVAHVLFFLRLLAKRGSSRSHDRGCTDDSEKGAEQMSVKGWKHV